MGVEAADVDAVADDVAVAVEEDFAAEGELEGVD